MYLNRMPYHIFITGNVGSGKSTFLKFLKKYVTPEWYEFIDLDAMAKTIIHEKSVQLPTDRNQVFEDVSLLYSVENQILPHIKEQLPNLPKFLIMEASTLFECPTLLSKDDITIHVSSNKHMEQTLNRDKVNNRGELISRVQVSPWIKSLISDVEITNNGTLDDLEDKAKTVAERLNRRFTNEFKEITSKLENMWIINFPELAWKDEVLSHYDEIDRTKYNIDYLLLKLTKLNESNPNINSLWTKALHLAVWFHKYEDSVPEKNIQALWSIAREKNDVMNAIVGSRSYISLACELIYSLHNEGKHSHSLHFGDGIIARETYRKVIKD